MRVVLVQGTGAWDARDDRWWRASSPFVRHLSAHGIRLVSDDRPFVWSTDVNGVFDRRHTDWRAGGLNLFNYLVPALCPDRRVPGAETVVIAHSHGGQVALYAAAAGLKIDLLVTVATPVRRDMVDVVVAARSHIRCWRHLHSGKKDWTQIFGALGDGGWGTTRAYPEADENVKVPEAGHSGFLNDPRFFPRWVSEWLIR